MIFPVQLCGNANAFFEAKYDTIIIREMVLPTAI